MKTKQQKTEIIDIIERIKLLLYTEICIKEKNIYWTSATVKENDAVTMFELKLELPKNNNVLCKECGDNKGWYGNKEINYNCSICNPNAL
jgi:hypothetical protein